MEQPPPLDLTPTPKKSNRLLIIILAVVGVCCCLFVVVFGLFTQFTPNLAGWSLGTLCPSQYPDLSAEECQSWAEDLTANHNQDLVDCYTEGGPNAGTPEQIFRCLESKGLGPED